MIRYVLAMVAALAGLTAATASAQPAAKPAPVQASAPLKERIAGLVPILNGGGDYDAFFAPGFRAQVPKDKFDQVRAQISANAGAAVSIASVTPTTPNNASVSVRYERATASIRLSVEDAAPYRVNGLLVSGITAGEANIPAVVGALKALPGSVGFVLARLGPRGPRVLESLNPEQPLAIGSAFKLVILAELVRATNAGERHWSDLVTLDGHPLAGGAFTQLPAGSRVSLEELALKMISVSDNSATDILVHTLGRNRIEAMLGPVGIRRADGMRPFMSPLEMFKLKGIDKGALAARYLALDVEGRRALLDGEVGAAPLSAIDPALFKDGKPLLIDKLEWFASPSDLVRLMDWLRVHTVANANARAILGRNPGISAELAHRWHYVGYKGGSEPGVINMTLLLQGNSDTWYVLAGTWNNPAAAVDDARFISLVGRATELTSTGD